jgi:hypothetical protein
MLPTEIRGDHSVSARFLAFVVLSALAVSSTARTKEVSPQLVACHDYATKRYIADFRQVSPAQTSFRDETPIVVTVFQNDSLRYEHYFAECMKRSNREKAQ